MKQTDAYLMVHFTQEYLPDGEQIYFAISRDGLHWRDVTEGKPMVRLTTGEKGMRDPFLLRGEKGDGFYLIATELCIANGRGWDIAQYAGSKNIVVFHSDDLVHWSEPELVKVGIDGAGCVWAPEAIYDREHDAYLVYWASMVREPGEERAKQRIYCGLTKDFHSFYGIQKYLERPDHVIDMTMLYDEGYYYRFYKDEVRKCVLADYSTSLWGGQQPIHDQTLDSLTAVEGPIAFRLPGARRYCFMADRFMEGTGYLPVVTEDLKCGPYRVLNEDEFDLGHTIKRHGGVAGITEEEYEKLARLG